MNVTADLKALWAVSKEEAKDFISWMWGQRNEVAFDARVLGYPRACMATAKIGEQNSMMVPFHPVLMFEAMAQKPDVPKPYLAACLYKIGELLEQVMKDSGIYQTYFICNDEDEVNAVSRRGWEIVLHDQQKGIWLMRRVLDVSVKVEGN